MKRLSRERILRISAALAWGGCMSPLLFWGLPSRERDGLLFGGGPAWGPERFHAAVAVDRLRERAGGADTDINPLDAKRKIVELTRDEDARAEILLRYRLYSRQPDEMITFRALQRMKPRGLDFDPKLYQYGGGYVYLIGAALGISSVTGFTTLTSNIDVYLASPELFARFYVVARCVSLAFGALALIAVMRLGRRFAGTFGEWLSFVFVAASPVFITGVLEAKPHIGSTCMILWAIDGALRWRESGRMRDALRMGLQGGYALGLVLTGVIAAAMAPVLLVLQARKRGAARQLGIAMLAAASVYLATNPYVPFNFLFRRDSLASNIGNSTAMYQVGRLDDGAERVFDLMLEGGGAGVTIGGALGALLLVFRRPREAAVVAASGVVMLAICVAIAAGKPAEFARFLQLPLALLAVAAAYAVFRLGQWSRVAGVLGFAVVMLSMNTPGYVRAFAADGYGDESRLGAARYLLGSMEAGDAIGVTQEPAPYATPPLDFVRRRVVLLPDDEPADYDPAGLPPWIVMTADSLTSIRRLWWKAYYDPGDSFPDLGPEWSSRITWADKQVFTFRRRTGS